MIHFYKTAPLLQTAQVAYVYARSFCYYPLLSSFAWYDFSFSL